MPTTTHEKFAKKTPAKSEEEDAKPRKKESSKRAKSVPEAETSADSESSASSTGSKKNAKTTAKSSGAREESSAEFDSKPRTKKRSSKSDDAADGSSADSTRRKKTNRESRAESDGESKSASKRGAKSRPPIELGTAVLQALATNERMNQYLLENLDDRAWTAPPPSGHGRTIAAIVSHMHNVRHMWLVVIAKRTSIPDKLDRKTVTKAGATKALASSSQALLAVFERALENGGYVKDFRPDVVGFLGYVIAHEAHHRGQICTLARELGMPLSKEASFGMWDWNKRWKESGY
jgi:uncharacterized damage-inducible protein DinB